MFMFCNKRKDKIMNIQNSQINFTGIKFPSRVSVKDAERLKQFLSDKNNIGLIKNLETMGTDIYFSSGLEKIGFSNHSYGVLDRFGAGEVKQTEFAQGCDDIIRKVSKALKKAEHEWAKSSAPKRGC